MRPRAAHLLALLTLALAPSALVRAQDEPAPPRPFAALVAEYEASAREPLERRAVALRALTAHRTRECVEYLDGVRRSEREPALRALALRLIGQVGVPPAQAVLEEVLDRGREAERRSALQGLTAIEPPVPPDRFLRLLADAEDDSLRVAAAWALRRYPRVPVAEALTRALADEPPPSLVNAACAALRELVGQQPVDAWFAQQALRPRRPPHPEAIPALLRAASACGHADLDAALFARLDRGRSELRAAAALALGERHAGRGEAASSVLARLAPLVRARQRDVALAAALAVGQIGAHGAALEALLELARDRPALALGALAGSQDPRVVAAAAEALEEKDRAARAAAVEALARHRSRAAVAALIQGLKGERSGRLQADIARALRGLTGADMGESYEDWAPWWESVGEGFELPDPTAPPSPASPARRTRARPTYHGQEVVSTRVAFLVDISYSMVSQLRVPDSTVPLTRLEVCQRELRGVIEALDEDTAFNVVAFANRFAAWEKRATRASDRHKEEAQAFVDRLSAAGGTNIYDPLAATLEDAEVDTIWLLSDGEPTDGAFIHDHDILREVRRLNAERRVAIHAISIGQESPLLRKLTEEHGGTYTVR